jgi:ATP-dependent DNA ligase
LSIVEAAREVFLFAFDLLEHDGRDLRQEPWSVAIFIVTLLRR